MSVRVGVLGAAGRMGAEACRAIEAADDLELVARIDVDDALEELVEAGAQVAVHLSSPDAVMDNLQFCLEHGVHSVVGTTGFDDKRLATVQGWVDAQQGAAVFIAPNLAIGSVLMMQFAAEASRHMAKAEIIELHHDQKLDAPSGTAARTAGLMQGDVPIHSVRLPGLVAHQEVILGDVGQTLTIRHDSINRESFMPGVLLAIRKVGSLERSPVIGLEHLL